MLAYCYASGRIEFSQRLPGGALPIARGQASKIRALVEATARRAYDGKTLLVPGVPEAPDQGEGVKALERYLDWIKRRARMAEFGGVTVF